MNMYGILPHQGNDDERMRGDALRTIRSWATDVVTFLNLDHASSCVGKPGRRKYETSA